MLMAEPSSGRFVRASVPRPQARPFIRGRGCNTDDLRTAGTLHAVFLRSPYVHTRIEAKWFHALGAIDWRERMSRLEAA